MTVEMEDFLLSLRVRLLQPSFLSLSLSPPSKMPASQAHRPKSFLHHGPVRSVLQQH